MYSSEYIYKHWNWLIKFFLRSSNKNGKSEDRSIFIKSNENNNHDNINDINKNNHKIEIEKEKDKQIIETWGKLKSRSIINTEELFDIKKINNYINDERQSPDPERMIRNINSISNPQNELNPEKTFQNKESPNMTYSISFIMKSFICKRKKNIAEKMKLQVFDNLKDYLSKRMDLIYYLRTLYATEITNSLLFNPFQKKLLEYPFKPNIFSSEDLHSFGLD